MAIRFEIDGEWWTSIKGYPDYIVSDLGKVKRATIARNGHPRKILKPGRHRDGYLQVRLYKEGKPKTLYLHILVAKAFIPNPKNLPEVNHLGSKSDCRATQLEWRSKEGNMQHGSKTRRFGGGVNFQKSTGKWRVEYYPTPGKKKYLGSFSTKKEAVEARDTVVAALPGIL